MAEPSDDPASNRTKPNRINPLQLKLVQAGLTISLERAWPWLVLASSIVALFLATVWFGLLILIPPLVRIIIVFLFFFAIILAVLMAIQLSRSSLQESIRRLDQDSNQIHHPITALFDAPELAADDPATLALWRMHQQKIVTTLKAVNIRRPKLDLISHDPFGLRWSLPLLALAGFFVAFPDHRERIEAVFNLDWENEPVVATRLDGWIDPPAYTRVPPILIDLKLESKGAHKSYTVPEGSELVVKTSDPHGVEVTTDGGLVVKPFGGQTQPSMQGETRLAIQSNGTVAIRSGKTALPSIGFEVVKDQPPAISLREEPVQTSNTLQLAYHASDDYGVHTIEARIALLHDQNAKLQGQHPPLIAPPSFSLPLPPDPRNGDAKARIEASDSPWAGIPIEFSLHATDGKGQDAATETVIVSLPQRVFGHPLARALIEQRRLLALNPDRRKQVLNALDALAIAPDHFEPDAGLHLVLHDIIRGLRFARSDADLNNTVQSLWSAAVLLEERDQGDEKKVLDAAREALKKALERGASPDEIKALSEQLKSALDAYLNSLAAKARELPNDKVPSSGKTVRPEDLQAMIDRMNELARNGAIDDAERMMQALNDILDQLQMASPSVGDPSEQQMNEALDGLDAMMRDQRALRDDTFRQGRTDTPTAPKSDPKALAERQKQLREQLNALRKGLKEKSVPDAKSLGEADEAMKGAEEALSEGDNGDALPSESKALDALRQGAQSLLKEMQGNGQGKGRNGQNKAGDSGSANTKDPLGRSRNLDSGDGALRQGGKDGSIEQRSREVVEELRRRLSDPERAIEERDYLRRLLEQQ